MRREWRLPIAAISLLVGGALSGSAFAQTVCNSSLVIGFPNGDNLNRVVGQTVKMSLTITNFPSANGGAPDRQTFTVIDFFPSCLSVAGGVCTVDPGETAGPPPPIQFNGNLQTANCPTLPVVDNSNPFVVKFTFVPPVVFPNASGCTFSFDVLVTERGGDGTPANIAQLANATGECGSGLTSEAGGTSAITLTCPPCDDGNACNGVETCNPDTAQCVPGIPLNCDDGNACTADSCSPATGCVHTPQPPSFCDDGNPCTDDSRSPARGGAHTHNTAPCNDGSACTTNDACSNGSCQRGPPPNCDDGNPCTDDSCNPASGCVH